MVKAKLDKVRSRYYIRPGPVRSLVPTFHVPKGEEDVRMVYNGRASGLNSALWSPHFGLPTMRHSLRSLLPGYFQCDMDVGEMFLNFWLHRFLRPYVGVDVTHVRAVGRNSPEWERDRRRNWEHWSRNCMGLRDSPYRSLQLMTKAKYAAYGNRRCPKNPFRWEKVILNLPGAKDYDPTLPWVCKLRSDGKIACDKYIYIDDGRLTGPTKLEAWLAARRVCSVLGYFGIQEAPRKRYEPLQEPSAWAGTVTKTSGGAVVATVTKEKWAKSQSMVRELLQLLLAGPMPHKRLEKIRGFLIYVARTNRWMTLYLSPFTW